MVVKCCEIVSAAAPDPANGKTNCHVAVSELFMQMLDCHNLGKEGRKSSAGKTKLLVLWASVYQGDSFTSECLEGLLFRSIISSSTKGLSNPEVTGEGDLELFLCSFRTSAQLYGV